jgi:hypothetical protein
VPYGHLWSIFAEVAKHGGIMAVHAEEDDVLTYMTEKLKREGRARRPRVRQTIGGEATLPSVAAFRDRDPLTTRMMQQLLAVVSTRHYEGSLEARPSGRPSRGSSKSAVSRAVVRRTRQRLQEYLARTTTASLIRAILVSS